MLWPIKATFNKKAATVEVDTFTSPVVLQDYYRISESCGPNPVMITARTGNENSAQSFSQGFSNVPWHKRAFWPGTKYVFLTKFWAFLGPCVWGRGRPWYNTSTQPESHFTCSSPRCAPQVVPGTFRLHSFWAFLRGLWGERGRPWYGTFAKLESHFTEGMFEKCWFSDRSFFMDLRAGCPCQNACFVVQTLERLTEVFGGMSAAISGPKLPLWADLSFLKRCLNQTLRIFHQDCNLFARQGRQLQRWDFSLDSLWRSCSNSRSCVFEQQNSSQNPFPSFSLRGPPPSWALPMVSTYNPSW